MANGESAAPVCDVYVRYSAKATRYSLVERDVPLDRATEMVMALRADPKVNWAYCTDPKERDEHPS